MRAWSRSFDENLGKVADEVTETTELIKIVGGIRIYLRRCLRIRIQGSWNPHPFHRGHAGRTRTVAIDELETLRPG